MNKGTVMGARRMCSSCGEIHGSTKCRPKKIREKEASRIKDKKKMFKEDKDHIYFFDTFIMKDWVKMYKSDIYYAYNGEDDTWDKIIFRRDISSLSDEFVFLEDGKSHEKGGSLTMDYGCMRDMIEKKELLTEEEYNNKADDFI
jgi:hypothetical protein